MANPAPRAALRKAPDADINPAFPHRAANEIDLRTQSVRLAHERRNATPTGTTEPKPLGGEFAEQASVDATAKVKGKKSKSAQAERGKSAKSGHKKSDKKRKESKRDEGKKEKKKSKKVKAGRHGGKFALSASSRQRLRAADKARGANLDEEVDSLVADLTARGK